MHDDGPTPATGRSDGPPPPWPGGIERTQQLPVVRPDDNPTAHPGTVPPQPRRPGAAPRSAARQTSSTGPIPGAATSARSDQAIIGRPASGR